MSGLPAVHDIMSFNEQQRFFIKCVSEWLRVSEENGYRIYSHAVNFSINMEKSALLKRLLNGKEAYPYPPPKCYSYPWYSLLDEEGYEGFCEVFIHPDSNRLIGKELVVGQSAWYLVEKTRRGYLAQYNRSEGTIWQIEPLSLEEWVALHKRNTPDHWGLVKDRQWKFTVEEEGVNQKWRRNSISKPLSEINSK